MNAIACLNEPQKPGKEQFKAVVFSKWNPEEAFKIPFIDPSGVGGPEKPVNHSLPQGKANSQAGGKHFFGDSITVFFYGKGVDLKLIFQ